MATISSFKKEFGKDTLTVEGQRITGSEPWILITDTPASQFEAIALINALTTGNAYGWKRIGIDPHSDNTGVYGISYSIDREDRDSTTFRITLQLSNDVNAVNRSRRALDAPASYSFQDVDVLIEVDVDPITGQAICASNGELYYPKPQRKGTLKRVIITRNEKNYNPITASNYTEKLNKYDQQIRGRSYPARSLMLESWTADDAVDVDGTEYYVVKYSILIDTKDLHKINLIDAGTGFDKDGRHPIARGAENKPYKFGRTVEGDGKYMTKADQQNPLKFYTRAFNLNEEIDFRFLRF